MHVFFWGRRGVCERLFTVMGLMSQGGLASNRGGGGDA